MTSKSGRTRQKTNNLRDELIWGFGLRQLTKVGVSLRRQNDIAFKDIFNKKRKCCNHRCPDSVYFSTFLLIVYLIAIQTLICRRKLSFLGFTFFGFAQDTIHDFQNTLLNSKWHCLRQIHKKGFY